MLPRVYNREGDYRTYGTTLQTVFELRKWWKVGARPEGGAKTPSQGWVKPCKKMLKHNPLKFCQAQAPAPAHLIWIGLKFKLKPLVKRLKFELEPFLWTIAVTIWFCEHQFLILSQLDNICPVDKFYLLCWTIFRLLLMMLEWYFLLTERNFMNSKKPSKKFHELKEAQ